MLCSIILGVVFLIVLSVGRDLYLRRTVEGLQCCQDCMGEGECYAYCSPDVITPCGEKTNDPITCARCSFCIWVDGPEVDGGKCVSREEYYTGSPSFAWPGYAPQYTNIYFAN